MCRACFCIVAAVAESVTVLERGPVPQGFTVCDFLDQLAAHEPLQFSDAVPAEVRGLTAERLVELADDDEMLQVQASDNGFIGPGNYDHNAILQTPMTDFARLLGEASAAIKAQDSEVAIEAMQSNLPRRLRELVSALLPPWVAFPAHEMRLWIDVAGPPRGTFLHNDAWHNVYLMLNGTKTFHVLPPWQSHLVGQVDAEKNYLAINDHWRWLASTNISKAHESWYSMGRDASGLANLSGASRIMATLHAGDVLILPRGWWHTTMQNGTKDSIAVNIWFDTRNPMLRLWWEMHQDLYSQHSSAAGMAQAHQNPFGESKKIDAQNRLMAAVRRFAPKSRLDAKSTFQKTRDDVLPSGTVSYAAEEGLCIKWEHDDWKTIVASLSRGCESAGANVSSLLELMSTARPGGQRYLFDMLAVVYLKFMGGNSRQPLGEWRQKLVDFYKTGVPPTPVDFNMFNQDFRLFKETARKFSINNHSLFGLLDNCESAISEGSLGISSGISSDPNVHADQRKHHPRCEDCYKSGLRQILLAGRCKIDKCVEHSLTSEL